MPVECEDKIFAAAAVVDKYIEDVLSGQIVTCQVMRLAIQRHLNDLENGEDRGLYFDPAAAQRVIDFFSLLKHSKGKWKGEPFVLEPWQTFIVWVLFGWMNIDGSRRFRVAYQEIARKNGKSTMIAGIGLYGLGFDGEAGSEVYSVATKEDQARITHREGQRMTRKSDNLGGLATVHAKSISIDSTDSCWKPLGKDSKTQDGLDPHYTLVDEFHAHPDRSMLDVMDSAVGARTQPLLFIITTAGFNMQSVCHAERDYAIKVLKGIVNDDTYFAIIFTLDEDDDWKDEKVWIKANPNLGVSVSIADMKRLRNKAIESPAALNNFLTKKCNIWTSQEVKWTNMEKWNAAKCFYRGQIVTKEALYEQFNVCDDRSLGKCLMDHYGEIEKLLAGRRCFGGLDLSKNNDISAWGKMFPLDDEYWLYLPKFYAPKDNAVKRERDDRVPYETWAMQGFLNLTKGNVIDYATIMADIWKDFGLFDVEAIAFDRYNFEANRQKLIAEGVPEDKLISFGQGYISMSAPMQETEKIILSEKLLHQYNPVLTWMASNVTAQMDAAGNVKPDKKKSSEKIDGMVSLIMALGIAITMPEKKKSVYDTGDYFKW